MEQCNFFITTNNCITKTCSARSATIQEGQTSRWAIVCSMKLEGRINKEIEKKEICNAYIQPWSLTAEVTNIIIKLMAKDAKNISINFIV